MEYYHLCCLVVSIYPPDLWNNVVNVKHELIVTQTHFRRYRRHHALLFLIGLFHIIFSGMYRCETDTGVSLPHHTKYMLGD